MSRKLLPSPWLEHFVVSETQPTSSTLSVTKAHTGVQRCPHYALYIIKLYILNICFHFFPLFHNFTKLLLK